MRCSGDFQDLKRHGSWQKIGHLRVCRAGRDGLVSKASACPLAIGQRNAEKGPAPVDAGQIAWAKECLIFPLTSANPCIGHTLLKIIATYDVRV